VRGGELAHVLRHPLPSQWAVPRTLGIYVWDIPSWIRVACSRGSIDSCQALGCTYAPSVSRPLRLLLSPLCPFRGVSMKRAQCQRRALGTDKCKGIFVCVCHDTPALLRYSRSTSGRATPHL